jgi:hypothetical protein
MLGKVIEFKAHIRQKKPTFPTEARLADSIVRQFLDEADAPVKDTHARAQILAFNQNGKGATLELKNAVHIRIRSPFTLGYWLAILHEPSYSTSY